jgi:lysophospholipase L1-like esterase
MSQGKRDDSVAPILGGNLRVASTLARRTNRGTPAHIDRNGQATSGTPRVPNLVSLILVPALAALLLVVGVLQPAAAATSPRVKSGSRYVGLGSSIASGYGIAVQSTTCGRSSRDYAQLVAKHFRLNLVDVSCGAAQIEHVVDTPQGTNPPQLTFLTPSTKLVTVAVGGNDIDYNATAVACSNATTCTAPANLPTLVVNMRIALKAMIAKIKAAAPSATIVFVTYPREVPAGENCPALGFTDSAAAVLRSMGQMLENAFLRVVKPLGVVFVDPYSVRGDHTVCAPPSQRWTAGSKYTFGVTGFAYHPTALGHEAMAQMIIKALGGR